MKIMKRMFIAALALLIAATPVTAFAASGTLKDDESHTIDVRAKYADSSATPDVYSIDVVWGAMQFTYTKQGTKVWDPSTHEYTDSVTSGWVASGNTVKVTNHSNKSVGVSFSYEKATGFDGIDGTFSVASDTLDAGVEGDVDGADSVSTELTLTGALADNVTEFTKIGTVTVSVQ